MTFAKRQIIIQLQLNGDTFDEGGDTLELKNIRCRATTLSSVGGATPFASQLQLQIWGMTGSDMAKLSTLGLSTGIYNHNRVTVSAGTESTGMAVIFDGGIFSASVDYNSMPEVSVAIEAYASLPLQLPRIDGSSHDGSVSVATMLQAIAANCTPPLSFVNKGVSSVLANHIVGGSAADQIADICMAAMCNYDISNGALTIWPYGATRDDQDVTISSDNGMVGYPMYSAQGVDVVMEFNANVQLGRKLNIETSIPKPGASNPPITGLPGTFYVWEVTHDLSAELPNGPWFTKARVGAVPSVAHAS